MSYSIYYDRAFIRVGDRFIPLAKSGSNNCFEYKNRREVPEMNWGILNWKHPGQALFTEAEIREIAREYDLFNQESWLLYKSRHRVFEAGEFERWVIGGMRNTYTVEEYHSFGNRLYVLDYSPDKINKWEKYYFSTTDELLELLAEFDATREINIKMYNNREVFRPVKRRIKGRGLRAGDLPECYILTGEGKSGPVQGHTIYFVRLTRTGFRYVHHKDAKLLKAFRSESEANRYIAKYAVRLNPYASFRPERFGNVSNQTGGVSA